MWLNPSMLHRTTARSLRMTLTVLAASLAIALAPAAASAATVKITMGFNDFTPASKPVARGATVKWVNPTNGVFEHNVQATAPRWYFYSTRSATKGDIFPGQSYRFTFRAAGTFHYVCSIHSGMDGTITVPISVAKLSGPVRFRITVASASASGAWRNEVQVRRPGASTWVRIARTTGTTVTYAPSKRGTYAFRSRVTNVTTGANSAWSPAVSRTF